MLMDDAMSVPWSVTVNPRVNMAITRGPIRINGDNCCFTLPLMEAGLAVTALLMEADLAVTALLMEADLAVTALLMEADLAVTALLMEADLAFMPIKQPLKVFFVVSRHN